MPTVLVIDDEQLICDLLRDTLGRAGYDVVTATSGAEGLVLFREHRPLVTLLDLHMARMDGLAVLQQLRGIDPLCTVIVLTAESAPELEAQVRALGVTDFIRKAAPLEVVTTAVDWIWDQSRTPGEVKGLRTPASPALLLVEDDHLVATILADSLGNRGFRVEVASNAAEALTAFDRLHPDLVLLDLNLPDRPGPEVFRGIRARGFAGPILAVTGSSDERLWQTMWDLGSVDVLGKPVDVDRLHLAIEVALVLSPAPGQEAPSSAASPAAVTAPAARSNDPEGPTPIRLLCLEDNVVDFELMHAMLSEYGLRCELTRVQTPEDFRAELERGKYDIVVSDFSLPSYDGRQALTLAREVRPDVPFLFFSGTIGEEAAVAALQEGAVDYVVKTRPARLAAAIERAVEEARQKQRRQRVEEALRQSEQRYALLASAAPVGIYQTDPQGRCLFVNSRWSEITQLGFEESLGTEWTRALHPDDRERVCDEWRRAVAAAAPFKSEYRFVTREGSIWVYGQVVPHVDDRGRLLGFIGTITDLTEQKKLEAQLHQAQKLEAIGRLSGGVAHDFNNMLTVIIGFSTLLQEQLPHDTPLSRNVGMVKEAAQRAAGLTKQLLAFSRQQMLDQVVLDLGAIVQGMRNMLQALIGEDVLLRVVTGPEPSRIKGDRSQVEQVVLNLAVNARDAMPTGGSLTLEVANVPVPLETRGDHTVAPRSEVVLRVIDTGGGMDADTQARIFDPFFTTKETGKGTGLGLATVYGIVKQSGGTIDVQSAVGAGTTFILRFPAVEEEARVITPIPTASPPPSGAERILLVEDEPLIRDLAASVLSEQGYVVVSAGTGDEALGLAQELTAPVALLITDTVLPGMSGPELAEQMRRHWHGVRVLYMSGYTKHEILQSLAVTSTTFLQKPFTPAQLLQKVRDVLSMPI